jgi:hypothetical protein
MARLLVGAAMLAGGIAALIEAHAHAPTRDGELLRSFGGGHVLGLLTLYSHTSEWPHPAYDVARIGGIVLVSVGGSLLIVAVVSLAHRALARRSAG